MESPESPNRLLNGTGYDTTSVTYVAEVTCSVKEMAGGGSGACMGLLIGTQSLKQTLLRAVDT